MSEGSNSKAEGVGPGDGPLSIGSDSTSAWDVLLEHAGLAYYRLDADGLIRSASRGWEGLTARSTAELIGQPMSDLLAFDEGEPSPLSEALRAGRASRSTTCRVCNDDGLARWIDLSCAPLHGPDGAVVGAEGLAREVTFWKEETARLHETAERYRALCDITSDCSYSFHVGPGGELIGDWTSDALGRMTGFTPEEARARGWDTLVHPEDLPLARQHLRAVLRGERHGVDYRIVTRAGAYTWVHDRAAPVSNASGRITRIVGALQDTTERRRMETKLAESLERYRTLFENANAAILIADAETGVLVDVNTDAERLFGKGREELIGTHQTALHPPEEVERYREMFRQHTTAERIASFEAEIVRAGGERVPVSIHGSGTTLGGRPVQIGVFQDLSERRAAETALRRENTFRRVIIEKAAQGIAVGHAVGGPALLGFTVWNDRMAELSGYCRDEINRVGWFHALWPDEADRNRAIESMSPSHHGPDALDETWDVVRKDGERRRWSISTTHIEGMLDEPPQVLALVSDLTEREQMAEQLRQSEKMEAIGQLAGGIAHDFNNQLAGIMGLADLLRLRLRNDEELALQAARIVAICGRSRGLTQQLLAFARRGQYQNVVVDLHEVVREVVSLLAHSIDKRITIHLELDANPSCCSGDPSQLQSAILNIAINARDAMPQGGELTFRSWSERLSASTEGLVLEIRDTGTGMSEDVRRKVFEPFFTTKPAGQGTGMGLAAAYGAVRIHDGQLEVESTPAIGSVFRMRLPTCEPAPGQEVATDAVQVPRREQRHARVLLVDDEREVREALEAMLEALEYRVTTCADGRDAVELYRRRWRELDAVVLDMVMPRQSGRQTFLALREINPRARVLLISGHSVEGKAQAVIDAGALGFLQKPFSLQALSRAMSAMFERDPGAPNRTA